MRIIGGNAKGTLLVSPQGKATRPTLGQVRESIFNVLSNVGIQETKVLDLFAGTGAMGLEALSRGAKEAVFFDKATARIIKENSKRCHVEDKAQVMAGDIRVALRHMRPKSYDYIFMDPPYNKGYVNEILSLLFACSLPADNAIIIVEHSITEPPDLSLFTEKCTVWKEKRKRDMAVTYLLCENDRGESS